MMGESTRKEMIHNILLSGKMPVSCVSNIISTTINSSTIENGLKIYKMALIFYSGNKCDMFTCCVWDRAILKTLTIDPVNITCTKDSVVSVWY